jgi:hypothetical protein
MGVNFSTDFCIQGKATQFEFNRVMRLHGEYTKAQLDGLYIRYVMGKEPIAVAEAMRYATIQNLTHDDFVIEEKLSKRQLLAEQKNLRQNAILNVLQEYGRALSVDEIVKLLGVSATRGQVMADLRKLTDGKQVTSRYGFKNRRYYKMARVSV